MTHKIDHRKLGLPSDQRMALLTNLQRQFIRHGYVRTTLGKAKETQRLVEKLITLGKKGDLHSRRHHDRTGLVATLPFADRGPGFGTGGQTQGRQAQQGHQQGGGRSHGSPTHWICCG